MFPFDIPTATCPHLDAKSQYDVVICSLPFGKKTSSGAQRDNVGRVSRPTKSLSKLTRMRNISIMWSSFGRKLELPSSASRWRGMQSLIACSLDRVGIGFARGVCKKSKREYMPISCPSGLSQNARNSSCQPSLIYFCNPGTPGRRCLEVSKT